MRGDCRLLGWRILTSWLLRWKILASWLLAWWVLSSRLLLRRIILTSWLLLRGHSWLLQRNLRRLLLGRILTAAGLLLGSAP